MCGSWLRRPSFAASSPSPEYRAGSRREARPGRSSTCRHVASSWGASARPLPAAADDEPAPHSASLRARRTAVACAFPALGSPGGPAFTGALIEVLAPTAAASVEAWPHGTKSQTKPELRNVLGTPTELVVSKIADRLNDLTRQFIERSPFVCVATAQPGGGLDVSPRGDPAGFVRILDERTLLMPDRPGNRIADTLTNLLDDSRIALLFLGFPGSGTRSGSTAEKRRSRRSRACSLRAPSTAAFPSSASSSRSKRPTRSARRR